MTRLGHEMLGLAIGEATARAMLIARMDDGRFGPPPDIYPPAPGIWRPTPPNFASDPAPWVGNVLPFLVPSAEMLRTDGPNALTSAAYTEDFNEVKDLGSLDSTTRTAGPNRCRDLLAGPRDCALEPDLSHASRQSGAGHRRERPTLRDGEPCCC